MTGYLNTQIYTGATQIHKYTQELIHAIYDQEGFIPAYDTTSYIIALAILLVNIYVIQI